MSEIEAAAKGATGDHWKSQSKVPACADCKRLKVKCARTDPDNPYSPCQRCLKKGIECVSRPLKRMNSQIRSGGVGPAADKSRKRRAVLKDSLFSDTLNSLSMRDQLLSSWKLLTSRDDFRLQLLEKCESFSLARPSNNVIRRGILDRAQVVERLNSYRDHIYPKFPAVECPSEEDLESFMSNQPILFHTILDIGSLMIKGEDGIESSLILHNLVLRTIMDEIMIVSVKNMEVLKCLVLLSHWYNECELYHQQRLHVLTALAVSVCFDLGMGGTAITTAGSKAPAFEQMVAPQATTDYNTPESYRVWLCVYSSLFQSLMANRRPVNSLWNRYTDDAIKVVSEDAKNKSPENESKIFSIWELALIRNLQERIALSIFKKNNEPCAPDYSDPAISERIERLDNEINTLRASRPNRSPRNEVSITICGLFLHQAVLYTPFDETIGRAPFTNFSLNIYSGPLSAQAQRSFIICVQSTRSVLDHMNRLMPESIAAESSNFWTAMTLCCDILLKCRACCIFNKHYAAACFVGNSDLIRVTQFTSLCDLMVKEYPNCNNAVSFGFFVRLILCHHDARIHYHSTRLPVETFGDPLFVMRKASIAQDYNLQEALDAQNEAAASEQSDRSQLENDSTNILSQAQQLPQRLSQSRQEPQLQPSQLQPQQLDPSQQRHLSQPQFSTAGSQDPQLQPQLNPEPLPSFGTDARPSLRDSKDDIFSGRAFFEAPMTNSNGNDTFTNQQIVGESMLQSYAPSSFADVQNDASVEPRSAEEEDGTVEIGSPFDFDSLELDVTALNEIDSFWNNFVTTKGNNGPFGVDFPM